MCCTLSQFSGEFMSTYATPHNKPSEAASKRRILERHLVPALGGMPLDGIGRRHVDAFQARQLAAGLSPKTVNNQVSVLHTLLAVAREWEMIDRVPTVRWLRTTRPDYDFLDFAEADRLLGAAEEAWRVAVTLAVRCGLRVGEILGLRWIDVDLVERRLHVRQAVAIGLVGTPKSGRDRIIPLGNEVATALQRHEHRGPLVVCLPDGGQQTRNGLKWPLRRAVAGAALRPIGWHVLRHTFASHLVMRGAPLVAVQQLLGHSTIEMTMRYAHLSDDARREAIALLDRPRSTQGCAP